MYQDKKIIALITARAGSKGLPGKNITELGGKPLIQWTIEAALASKYIDKVVVSTDGEDIAQVARQCGVDVPFLRPKQLADDNSAIEDVINHSLDWFKTHQQEQYDSFILLQPTSPFRTSEHIDTAITKYHDTRQSTDETLVSVTSAPAKMGWLMTSNGNGHINFCFEQVVKGKRRQHLPSYYLPNGAIYIADTQMFEHSFYTDKTQFFVMTHAESIDIDTFDDLESAKKLLGGG